jgi:hypothetical protein
MTNGTRKSGIETHASSMLISSTTSAACPVLLTISVRVVHGWLDSSVSSAIRAFASVTRRQHLRTHTRTISSRWVWCRVREACTRTRTSPRNREG